MNDELAQQLIDELRATRRELRQLRAGELVARLTEAERVAIAEHVLDRLDERFAAERKTATDNPPRREPAKTKRGRRRSYFKG